MAEELIVVRQLPIIEERLRSISEEIQSRTKEALSLACTDTTVKEIKRVRAEMTKTFTELETARKLVKKEVLAPYEEFEKRYRAYITNIYTPADTELKRRIVEVETAIKDEKRVGVCLFFDEYAKSKGVDFLDFDSTGIKVTLSSTAKALNLEVVNFLDKVAEELEMISVQAHSDEILVEYKKTLNASNAITTVTKRHEAIEAERVRQEELRIKREKKAQATQAVMKIAEDETPHFSVPAETKVDQPEEPEVNRSNDTVYGTAFKVQGTLAQLKALKGFLNNGGYVYESA